MLHKSVTLMFTFLSISIFWSCDQRDNITTPNEPVRTTKEFQLWGDYTNTNRTTPQFTYNPDSSNAGNITFGGIEASVDQGQVTVRITNLSIADSIGNYVLDSNDAIRVEEKREGRVWISDTEFSHEFESLTTIAVVLALDVSGSLGPDFNSVKNFAKEFLQIVLQDITSSQIGVVVFSNQIQALPLTSDVNAVIQFIDRLSPGENSTALYDAMLQGVAMLANLDVDGKALVSFTDGADNFSEASSSDVIQALSNSDIKSFTIGLTGKGNLDSQVLSQLAVNGVSRLAESVSVLQTVFQRFSREITNVYNLTYIRNDQQITVPMAVRFIMEGSVILD